MTEISIQYLLKVYKLRLSMQNEGITNPSKKIKDFTKEIVEKLSTLPLDQILKVKGDFLYDSAGNVITVLPKDSD